MRIDGFQNIPAILSMLKSGRTTQSSASSEGTNDTSSVNLSSFGTVLQSIQRDAASKIKAREAMVQEVSESIRQGTMKVDYEQLASKMVDMQIIDFKR